MGRADLQLRQVDDLDLPANVGKMLLHGGPWHLAAGGAVHDDDVKLVQQLPRTVPGMQVSKRIGARQEVQLRVGTQLAAQNSEGIEREGRSVTLEFNHREFEFRVVYE